MIIPPGVRKPGLEDSVSNGTISAPALEAVPACGAVSVVAGSAVSVTGMGVSVTGTGVSVAGTAVSVGVEVGSAVGVSDAVCVGVTVTSSAFAENTFIDALNRSRPP